ncbi:MAG: trypsin-like peptidase domain-containing protein [Planctomycetaceae bacterium]|nr:trypsin-like peptidase domain-containing protein [Planctomycetaceae bacterium]
MLVSLVSSIVGSTLTVWWLTQPELGIVNAQDAGGRNARFAASPVEQFNPALGRVFDMQGLTTDEAVSVAVYEVANRCVVNIESKSVRTGLLLETQAEGSGSGAVIDADGHILTNYHVVQDASELQVTLFNSETYEAKLVGADPLNDVAVIQVEAPRDELFPITIGDSKSLKVGMRVYALGNPFGLERTLTTGIISSLNRSLQIRSNWSIKSIIQIDAAINPGSSGGPLLDSHGRLIGINTAIATTSGQSAGVGFAIPVSLVQRVVPQLLKHGRVIRAETGISRVFQTDEGLMIAELKTGGAAERAGLKGPKVTRMRRGPFTVERVDRSAADIIVAVDGEKTTTVEDFLSYIDQRRPGETVEIEVVRDGQKVRVRVQLTASEPVTMP